MAASSCLEKRDFFILVEVRPLLRVANVFIQNHMFNSSTTKVQIEKNRIELTFGVLNSETKPVSVRMKQLSFIPGSCSGFTCVGNVIQFRVQLDDVDTLLKTTEKLKMPQVNGNAIKAGVSYRGICSFCGTDIVNRSTTFRRVLPLPSSGALEMSDSWFCHKHENEDDFDVSRCLQPKDNDCLTGENYILLNSRNVDLSQLIVEQSAVTCKRCLKEVGEVASSSDKNAMPHFQFHSHSVLLIPDTIAEETGLSYSSLIPSHHALMKNTFISLLLNTQENMTSRLCLKTKDQDGSVLLVWLIEGETMILAEESCNTLSDLGPACSALKVLYCIVPKNSEILQQWMSDVNVSVVTIVQDLHSYALNVLVDATSKLPVVCRKLDMYWMAYLLHDALFETANSRELD